MGDAPELQAERSPLPTDCSGTRPLEGPLKEQLEQTLAAAERFTQQYNRLLRNFEEQMFNTSSILDLFNSQFGWVSTLANSTNSNVFRVHTVTPSPVVVAANDLPSMVWGGVF